MRYAVRLILISICVIVYCIHSEVYQIIYPEVESNYDEFLEYYASRNILNEFMYALLFLCVFLNSYNWVKSVAIFGFVMTFGSLIDKAIFGVNEYLITDIILLIFATRVAWVVRKERPPNGQT